MRASLLRYLAVSGVVVWASPCVADRVQLSLDLGHQFIESVVREQVFGGQRDAVRINDDGSGCQYLELSRPRVSASAGQLRLLTDAAARAGRAVGDRCILVLDWRGQLEFTQRPEVSEDRRSIVLYTENWRALTPDGRTDTLSTTVGRWLEQFLPPGLRATRIELVRPLQQLQEFLEAVITPADAAQLRGVLDSVAIDSAVVRDDRIGVVVGLNAPLVTTPPAPPAAALSETELAQLVQRLDDLDAFVTATIKELITDPAAAPGLDGLFDLLLDLRMEVVAVAAAAPRRAPDPVRVLFVSAWDRLVPVLSTVAGSQPDTAKAAAYLGFISSGDALRALDRLGPAAGIEVTSDGLRRLARMLAPPGTAEPLDHDQAVDPELRRAFGFGDPLPPPAYTVPTSWLDWLVRPALAGDGLKAATVKRLNNWVPTTADMDTYLPMVRDVLNFVVGEQLRARGLDRGFHEVFRRLVLAAAWQESCWRQFVARRNKRVPLESGSGDIGMMQINPKVWRGFYDQHGLKWDIVYNARAGADILEHHLVNYGIGNREHKTTGKTENLARAAYAAYNGGPKQYDRYRRRNVPAAGRKADGLFWEKYQAVASGRELAVQSCFRGLK